MPNKLSLTSKPLLAAIGLYVILPNLLFWLAASVLKLDRPIVNLDYLLAGSIFIYGWRKLASLMLVIFLLMDLLVLQGLAYPVVRLQDVIYLLSLLPYAAFIWQAAAIGLVLALALIVGTLFRHGHRANRLATLALLFLGVSVYAAQVNLDELSSDFYRTKTTAVGSQAGYFANMRAVPFFDALFKKINPLVSVGFKDEVAQWAQGNPEHLNKKMLLIIVESWGVMKDGRIQKALLEPFFEKSSSFHWVKTGEVTGGIATVAAELDKLCGLEARHFNLSVVTEGFESCLPWKLKQNGYKTAAIHGATGAMYGRTDWYPRAGFDEMHFKETHSWKTHCHSFPGVCDSEIMEKYISSVFSADEKRFVYWLTLNTHSLYDRRDIQQDVFNCQSFQLEEGGEVCRMNKLHAQFFHQLAELLTHPAMSGVEVLLVGDHAPLILDRNEYKQHVKDGMVSKLHLRVK
jgi:hypothetical protein